MLDGQIAEELSPDVEIRRWNEKLEKNFHFNLIHLEQSVINHSERACFQFPFIPISFYNPRNILFCVQMLYFRWISTEVKISGLINWNHIWNWWCVKRTIGKPDSDNPDRIKGSQLIITNNGDDTWTI
jgi:hypothetical protein